MKPSFSVGVVALFAFVVGLSACGGSSTPAAAPEPGGNGPAAPAQASIGDAAAGKDLFTSTCSACHGPDGAGIAGLGKDLTASEFVAGQSDNELVEFIKAGRDVNDPLNTTGVPMPPKGGNPALSDENLSDIVAYLRTIQK
ncbi:MAG: c-type cytochrome [Anaerolineae bacterium]